MIVRLNLFEIKRKPEKKKKSAENAENQLATTQDIKIKSVETVEIEADIKPLLSERRIEGLERD